MNIWYPNSRFKKKLHRVTKPIQHTVLSLEINHCIDCGLNIRKKKKRCPECSINAIRERSRNKDIVKRIRIKQNGYEYINTISVFDRDGWRCKLCKVKTPKELVGKILDNAPTLDHIIPISKGGPHTYANVQLLCRRCNCKVKRDIVMLVPLLDTSQGGSGIV